MRHCLIVHGTLGKPDGNWFPWLAAALGDMNVLAPVFPTPEGQSCQSWLEVAEAALAGCDPAATILVGHSVGALLVLHCAARAATPYKAVFAVCPFVRKLGLEPYDTLNASFLQPPPDWQAVARGARQITCFAGANDPYVPLSFAQDVAAKVGAACVVVPEGGHLNAEAGFDSFPLLLRHIRESEAS